jgi:hypothetical protein
VATQTHATLRGAFERITAIVLHLWNLPAASDLRRLASRLPDVERELRRLNARLERSQQHEAGEG